MTKSFVLNVKNLTTADDVAKIQNHFATIHGVEKVDIELELKLVSIHYNEDIGSPSKLLTTLDGLGYPVR